MPECFPQGSKPIVWREMPTKRSVSLRRIAIEFYVLDEKVLKRG